MAQLTLGRPVVADAAPRLPAEAAPAEVSVATDDLVTHGVIVGMTGSVRPAWASV